MDNQVNNSYKYTRKTNPKLGLLGLLGFLGFMGFLPVGGNPASAFFFFGFFGFFGFYFEGKMSNTLIDERFQTNKYRAESIANKISLYLIFGFSIIIINRGVNTQDTLSMLIAMIGVFFGLSAFLPLYLLYKFENEN